MLGIGAEGELALGQFFRLELIITISQNVRARSFQYNPNTGSPIWYFFTTDGSPVKDAFGNNLNVNPDSI